MICGRGCMLINLLGSVVCTFLAVSLLSTSHILQKQQQQKQQQNNIKAAIATGTINIDRYTHVKEDWPKPTLATAVDGKT
eukprot:3097370-Ditylum_brightwellii.AAC.1